MAALEPKFFGRLCELVGLPEPPGARIRAAAAPSSRHGWPSARSPSGSKLFDGEDVCAGPVATVDEAAEFRAEPPGQAPEVGEHTEAWRQELEGSGAARPPD